MGDENINDYLRAAWVLISSAPSDPHSRNPHTKIAPNIHNSKRRSISLRKYHDFATKYRSFVSHLVYNSQLTSTNLVISLYYLYKYHHSNSVLSFQQANNDEDDDSMGIYVVLMSLILANKSYDDQSYTLKTWMNIIQNTLNDETAGLLSVDLALLNSLESYFLSCLDYKLSFNTIYGDTQFWAVMGSSSVFKLPSSLIHQYKQMVNSESATSTSTLAATATTSSSLLASPGYTPVYATASPYRTPPNMSSSSSPLGITACSSRGSGKLAVGHSPLTPLTPYHSDYHYKRRHLSLHHQAFQNRSGFSQPVFNGVAGTSVAPSFQIPVKPVFYVAPRAQYVFPPPIAPVAPVAQDGLPHWW